MSYQSCTRREFLLKTAGYASLAISGWMFGRHLTVYGQECRRSTALVYATRYGATKECAEWILAGMGAPADLLDIERISYSDVLSGYDRLIIGSGIWANGVDQKILDFFEAGRGLLDEKLLATFIVCGSTTATIKGRAHIDGYFSSMHKTLSKSPSCSRAFGGRLIVEKLNDEDHKALTAFYRSFLQTELRDWDRTDPNQARSFGSALFTRL
ncbi:flavodoxin domain-containing protein [Pelodictyon luteolum]|nr:flavodoxin domain-containing protein [Pelodictyon luteolum]